MFRAVLYLAIGLVASSMLATAISSHTRTVSCSGMRVDASNVELRRAVARETCVAAKP